MINLCNKYNILNERDRMFANTTVILYKVDKLHATGEEHN